MIWVMIAVFLIGILVGIPMAFSAGLAVVLFLADSGMPATILAQRVFVSIDNFSLMAIPLFILAGDLMNNGGITKRILRLSSALVGHIKGSLAHVCILASTMFAAMSGSSAASCSCMGSMLIPAMKEEKYDEGFAAAVTASASILGPVIPPSIGIVLYASVTGVSVGSMFMGGVLPGVFMALCMMVVVYIIAKKRNYPVHPKATWHERGVSFVAAVPALIAPLIIIGGILTGIFTATEAGVVASLYAMIVGFVTKELTWKQVAASLRSAANVTAAILFITGTCTAFSWILTSQQVPQKLSASLLSLTTNGTVYILICVVMLLFFGCFLVETAIVPMLAPIFWPIAQQLGVQPIHFGIIFVMVCTMGALTPPVGSMLFVSSKVGNVPIAKIIKELIPLLLALFAALLLVIFIPQIATLLPSLIQ